MAQREPPNSLEAEVSVLGSMLMEPECIPQVAATVEERHLSRPGHRYIYRGIVDLWRDGEAVDLVVVAERLKARKELHKAGGHAYLAYLMDAVPAASNAAHYAGVVLEKANQRQIILACEITLARAGSGAHSALELLTEARSAFDKAAEGVGGDSGVTAHDMLADWDPTEGAEFLTTGIGWLDDMLGGGLERTNCVIIGARPSVGKTSVAVQMAAGQVLEGLRVGILSMEMGPKALRRTLIAQKARIHRGLLRSGLLNADLRRRAAEAAGVFMDAPLWIFEGAGLSGATFGPMAERHITEHSLDVLYVDYIQQLAAGVSDSFREHVSRVARDLKIAAAKHNCITVGLSQLRRPQGDSPFVRPHLGTLRESGEIEAAADVVMLLHLPEEKDGDGNGPLETIIAKNREGRVGTRILSWVGRYTLLEEMSHADGSDDTGGDKRAGDEAPDDPAREGQQGGGDRGGYSRSSRGVGTPETPDAELRRTSTFIGDGADATDDVPF